MKEANPCSGSAVGVYLLLVLKIPCFSIREVTRHV